MLKIIDEMMLYQNHARMYGECKVQVLMSENGPRPFVVFTELLTNKGPSVTNNVEVIIDQFCKEQKIKPEDAVFYERYEGRNELDQIILGTAPHGNPTWRHMDPHEALRILAFL